MKNNNLVIGCSGFVVPKNKYYTKLNAIELKEFYLSLPSTKTADTWRQEAPEDFIFSLVATKWITQSPSNDEKSPLLTGDRNNYGDFKTTKENIELYEKLFALASILKSPTILFVAPPNMGPSVKNIKQLVDFFNKIPRDNISLILEPHSVWSDKEIIDLANELKLTIAFDPFDQKPLIKKSLYYARMSVFSSFNNKLTLIQQEKLKELINLKGKKYIFFGQENAWDIAKYFINSEGLSK